MAEERVLTLGEEWAIERAKAIERIYIRAGWLNPREASDLRAERDRLREALEWFADETNYESDSPDHDSAVQAYGYERATLALGPEDPPEVEQVGADAVDPRLHEAGPEVEPMTWKQAPHALRAAEQPEDFGHDDCEVCEAARERAAGPESCATCGGWGYIKSGVEKIDCPDCGGEKIPLSGE